MRQRGSVSFVVEVKKRRFAQNGATSSDLDRSRIAPIRASGLSVTPSIAREGGSHPAIEAAKIAVDRLFRTPSSPQSVRENYWSDYGGHGFNPPARPVDVALQTLAGDRVGPHSARPDGQVEKPRPGRILQSLIEEDPIDALLRREAEERSTRRQPHGPRARSVSSDRTNAAVPTDSRQMPGSKWRDRKVVTDPDPAVDMPRDKIVRRRNKKATKSSRRGWQLTSGRTQKGRREGTVTKAGWKQALR
jgi:hypothetical protein